MMRFFERLKESLRELREELEQTTEAIERLGRHLESLNRPSRHDRRFPPYRKKLNPMGHVRPVFLAQNQVEPSQKKKATLGAENQRTQIK